jgi:translation elongation factor EF-Tu-like GTPase
MRVYAPLAVTAASLLFVAGCGTQSSAAAGPITFTAGEEILVDLSMKPSNVGGRSGPFYSGYRPQVSFASAEAIVCTIKGPAHGEPFAPGTRSTVPMVCTAEVTVGSGDVEVGVLEGGREVGSGSVRF